MKRFIALTMAFVLILSMFTGCSADEESAGNITDVSDVSENTGDASGDKIPFRILVDSAPSASNRFSIKGLGEQLSRRVGSFRRAHPELEVIIEEIPVPLGERTAFMQNIKTEILTGNGPDVMILQNDINNTDRLSVTYNTQAFFEDVNLVMRNGMFLDLSEYYDVDTELTAGLREDVMDAGVVDGARYALPLRYDFPVVYVDKKTFAERGYSPEIFNNFLDFLNCAAETSDCYGYESFRPDVVLDMAFFNFFPEIIDYENGTVTLSAEELIPVFEAYKEYRKLRHSYNDVRSIVGAFDRIGWDVYKIHYWTDDDYFMYVGMMSWVVGNVYTARYQNVELDMYPLRAIDGSVIADVTLFGAVSAGTRNPELAYEFLREFLTENYQWDLFYPSSYREWTLPAAGWPVRADGAFEAISRVIPQNVIMQNCPDSDHAMDFSGISSSNLPILDTKIDKVRFSLPEVEAAIHKSIDNEMVNFLATVSDNGEIIKHISDSDTSPEGLAEYWIKYLKTHISEG